MRNAQLARRRRKADDPVFLHRVAWAVDITPEQAHEALHWWLDQLEPLSAKKRNELLSDIPILNRMLCWRRRPSTDRS